MLIIFKSHAADGHGTSTMARHPAPGEPTPAQAEAGNYSKRLVLWNGLRIRVENEAGTIRHGRGWQTRMLYPYGYIQRSEGSDGDEVDVYLGPALDFAPTVFVVHQRKYGRWNEYDEDKCMLGFMSMDDAATAYAKHYDDPRFLGPITEMPVEEFVAKVRATRERPGMIKALDFGSLIIFKSRVGPYLRGGKLVNMSGYQGRAARAQPAPGQASLFTPDEAPPPEPKPNPFKGKDPVLDTPDLFTGQTRREAPVAPPAAPPANPTKPHPLERSAAYLSNLRERIAAAKTKGDETSRAFLEDYTLPHKEGEHRALEAAFAAHAQHGDGTELSNKDGRRHAILLPDASNPGKYRYQMFDERGFMSHSTHDTPEDAVADAVSQGYHVHNPGILDRLAGTDEWAHGMAVNAVMQAHNGGQIDWRTAMDKIKALADERDAKRAGSAAPAPEPADSAAPVAPAEPDDGHPSKPTRSMLNLVPEGRRAEWLDLHRRQHEMYHYDLGQLKEQIAKHRAPMHRALTKLRESEAAAAEVRKGSQLPGSDERIRLAYNAVAQNSIEFQRHSKEVERLKNMHQTVYERVAKLGREKNAIASETGNMDIDFAAMRQRTGEEQAEHEKSMLKRYREHYKAQDVARRAAKKAGSTMAKAWDWLGTEPVLGQHSILFLRS